MPRDSRTAPRGPRGKGVRALRRGVLGTALAGALVVGGGTATGLLTLPGSSAGDSIVRTVAADASDLTGRTDAGGTGTALDSGSRAAGETVLRFRVPAAPAGYVVDRAQVAIQIDSRSRARLGGDRAARSAVSYRAQSGAEAVVGEAVLKRGAHELRFDVTDAVPRGGGAEVSVSMPSAVNGASPKTAAADRPQLEVKFRSASTKVKRAASSKPVVAGTAKPFVPLGEGSVRIGMSAPAKQWSARLAETGPIGARRIFGRLQSTKSALKLAAAEVKAGRMPILSFKVPNNDWAGVAAGKYDAQLRQLTSDLAALDSKVFVTLHHEPMGDGTPANYAAMMRHALPILGAPASVDAGPIVNGFWWSEGAQGLTDAEIAQWLPADVLRVSETVAADTYQGGTTAKPGENAGVKIRRFSAWATRVGVKSLGIGEYNGLDAASIKAAGDAILADPRYSFATIFNSDVNNRAGVRWSLSGDRLEAFRRTVQAAAG